MRHLSTRKYVGWMVVAAVVVVFAGCPQESTETVDANSIPPKADNADENAAKGTVSDPLPEADPKVNPDQPSGDDEPTDPDAEPGTQPDGEPDVDPSTETDAEPDPEPSTDPEPDADPLADPEPDSEPTPDPDAVPDPAIEPDPEPGPDPYAPAKMPDLGAPLVDNPENLKKLDPKKPLWVDQKIGRVVMIGQVCQTDAALEMFACLWQTKEHEAIVTVDVEAFKVHAGLLAIGAEAGHPVQFQPVYTPAKGSEIEISVSYKDKDGKRKTVRAQDWIQDTETDKAMTHNWVFGGSGFWKDADGRNQYLAEGGDFICVSNFSTAMLDLPVESSQADSARMCKAFTERIPPIGTPVTLVLEVKKKQEEKK
ncbi:MAG: hypothetical protein HQ567_04680 [Candidatus Nealsonbacteria bacterium]|nr:hypothetical protein [Candidatus Nealsonbacteria bacterium]